MQPEEPVAPLATTDSIGSPIFIREGPADPTPPERRKIDPSTIWWPEGEPKPWEQPPKGPDEAK
jgi:hypothetical protein